MNDLLLYALDLAEWFETYEGFDGMADVTIRYHPYESSWFAAASWSNGKVVQTSYHEMPESALKELTNQLMELRKNDLVSRFDVY